ncbi:transmembrane and TPR repeat-containing protein 3 [Geobacter sp. OR-1]|uniref:hypothetical protein n=1 Tax=Geobacter sp. OR-1 TaxID=1266765 RepID=UPI0005427FEF|nr:hypothetical protein [Geobacter sp. OR-1]GAM11520.1 transmembrane and TPR repeat-containing protein 3 [Geobacter sp. OR-1]
MRIRYQIMLLIIVVLGAYYPSLSAPLNSVDDPGMYSYLLNTDNFSLRSLFFPGRSGGYYRPLLVLSFLFDKYVWGLELSFMHLGNILVHLCNAILVYFITHKASTLIGRQATYFPLTAAILFAVHPIGTESVCWISGRTDLLAGVFSLAVGMAVAESPLDVTALSGICMLYVIGLSCQRNSEFFFCLQPSLSPFSYIQAL